jgi:hypothetical protein
MAQSYTQGMLDRKESIVNEMLKHAGSKVKVFVGGRYGYKAIDWSVDKDFGMDTLISGLSKKEAYNILAGIEFGLMCLDKKYKK